MSANRLRTAIEQQRESGSKSFVVYLCAGDPDLDATVELVCALAEAGVDIIELGIPYSDPMADGPAIQAACERGLASGTTVRGVIAAVARIRARTDIPIMFFTYLSPVLAYGVEAFARDAAAAGVDGILLLDLPPEEDATVFRQLRDGGLANVCLIAPNTEQSRRSMLAAASRGFVYYVCRYGVTGERAELPDDLEQQVAAIRASSDAPVCIGFGISTPEQAAAAARYGDGVVVGSHLVRMIERHGGSDDLVTAVAGRAAEMAAAVHAVG
ncbi:MAG: tryptophan synthase subunit alpha [Planctomycetota bacterium]